MNKYLEEFYGDPYNIVGRPGHLITLKGILFFWMQVRRKGATAAAHAANKPGQQPQQPQPKQAASQQQQQHSHDKLTKSLENAHRLLDVKAAIEQVLDLVNLTQ